MPLVSLELGRFSCQVFVGDMERWEDVSKASMEIDYVYFCYPVQAGLLEATTLCARAARDHGVLPALIWQPSFAVSAVSMLVLLLLLELDTQYSLL